MERWKCYWAKSYDRLAEAVCMRVGRDLSGLNGWKLLLSFPQLYWCFISTINTKVNKEVQMGFFMSRIWVWPKNQNCLYLRGWGALWNTLASYKFPSKMFVSIQVKDKHSWHNPTEFNCAQSYLLLLRCMLKTIRQSAHCGTKVLRGDQLDCINGFCQLLVFVVPDSPDLTLDLAEEPKVHGIEIWTVFRMELHLNLFLIEEVCDSTRRCVGALSCRRNHFFLPSTVANCGRSLLRDWQKSWRIFRYRSAPTPRSSGTNSLCMTPSWLMNATKMIFWTVVWGSGPGRTRPHNRRYVRHRGRKQPRHGRTAAVE